MPDLDQLLDTFVADVTASTRAPGASTAITQARRRRRVAAAAGAVLTVAVIVAGSALAAGSLGGSAQPSPIGVPTTPPESPIADQTLEAFGTELEGIFALVPGWAVSDRFPDGYDYAFNGPCSGGLDGWGRGFVSGGDGGMAQAGTGTLGFSSAASASDAAARLVANLESCTATAWQAQPIAGTDAMLASSATGVAWIQQTGDHVDVLQVPTTDGPPPAGVQVEVAEWMVAYRTWQEQS